MSFSDIVFIIFDQKEYGLHLCDMQISWLCPFNSGDREGRVGDINKETKNMQETAQSFF